MKLNSAEGKAVSFILLMIAVSLIARALSKRDAAEVTIPATAGLLDAETHSTKAKKQGKQKKANVQPLAPGERVDPNTATVPELDRLPGVGPALAAAIVKDRTTNGPFRSTADLARVKGLSAARARSLSEHVKLPESAPDAPTLSLPDRAQPVSLNSATTADLDRISGVSHKLALRILAVRDSLRGFRDWSQIDAIPGVGPKLLERLKTEVTLTRS
jgi:competence ComEA-like helix-hairpin-helix protein